MKAPLYDGILSRLLVGSKQADEMRQRERGVPADCKHHVTNAHARRPERSEGSRRIVKHVRRHVRPLLQEALHDDVDGSQVVSMLIRQLE